MIPRSTTSNYSCTLFIQSLWRRIQLWKISSLALWFLCMCISKCIYIEFRDAIFPKLFLWVSDANQLLTDRPEQSNQSQHNGLHQSKIVVFTPPTSLQEGNGSISTRSCCQPGMSSSSKTSLVLGMLHNSLTDCLQRKNGMERQTKDRVREGIKRAQSLKKTKRICGQKPVTNSAQLMQLSWR